MVDSVVEQSRWSIEFLGAGKSAPPVRFPRQRSMNSRHRRSVRRIAKRFTREILHPSEAAPCDVEHLNAMIARAWEPGP